MSEIEFSRKESLSRKQVADRLSALAAAFGGSGPATVELGTSTVTLRIPEELRCEVELEVEGDDVELEIELKWSTVDKRAPEASSS